MIIQILGGGTHNKGAELMAQVVINQVRNKRRDAQFAVERSFGTYEERGKYGLRTLLPSKGIRSRLAANLMANSYKAALGLVSHDQVDAVLDISGFAYGDQWGNEGIALAADYVEAAKRRSIPYVLMPQAFGPFSSSELRDSAKRLVGSASLVFAREKSSLEHIRQLGIDCDHVALACDFTNLSSSYVPDDCPLPEKFVCFVPNIRMMDMADRSQSNNYIQFMANAIKTVKSRGLYPIYVFHDLSHDKQVAALINGHCPFEIPCIAYEDPQVLKGILGKSELVIGSRFHALVGALCQGVPVIATSWSHKYEELLAEYGIPEFVIQPAAGMDKASGAIEKLVDPNQRSAFVETIKAVGEEFRYLSEQMFNRTFAAINI